MKTLWNFVCSDKWRILLAFFLTLLLYCNFRAGQLDTRLFSNIPVTVELAPDLVLPQQQDFFVKLSVRGTKQELDNLSNIRGRIKVAVRGSGNLTVVQLHPSDFECSSRIRIEKVIPASLSLPIQQKISRNVPVKPRFAGNPSAEYSTEEACCTPAEVLVTGPEQAVHSLRSIDTEEIPLKDVTASFSYEPKLVLPQGMTASPEKIFVQVDVVRSHADQSFPKVPVLLSGSPDSGLRADFAGEREVDVTLSGIESRIKSLRQSDIVAYINLSGIREPGVYAVPVDCHVKGDAAVKAVSPGEIRIKLTKVSAK